MSSRRLAALQLRLASRIAPAPAHGRALATTSSTPISREQEWLQHSPLGDYYTSILRDPIPYSFEHKPEIPPSTAHPSTASARAQPSQNSSQNTPAHEPPALATTPTTAQEKARIIFGSRLLGPAEQADRLLTKQAKSTYIAGVLVPPRPEEPDNCCMSGCVNCVWDRYREDMEEWTSKKREAEDALAAAGGAGKAGKRRARVDVKVPVSDAKIAKDMWDDAVYQGVPVGFREFMKVEKRLKEKHEREGTTGG